jgi:plastocyanin
MSTARLLRLGGAVALLVAGVVHLDLYFGGYRAAGSVPAFGRAILLDAVVSAAIAALVAVRREWFVRLAGIVVAAASLGALWYTHRGNALLGFEGDGLQPSPQVPIVIVAELAAIVVLAATFLPAVARSDESLRLLPSAVAALAVVIVMVGFGAVWSGGAETAAEATGPSRVVIADFTFAPADLSVPAGTTVTWTNGDPFPHSVVAADGSFTSVDIEAGAQFTFTFDAAGTYDYVCGIHPAMTGTITVTG